ncbi:MAG TPA: twin-arginine translocase TatA/TatE family subunit [Acidimicrobiales bacterium]|nr:twin-arginine translocase TatA/TatE family subunit [Acidimicrobiales bacterium]
MLSLSPAKILVILVVALLVLGPDKLPGMARQIGALWHDLRNLRGRLETEVRGAFPDLPSPQQVAQAVRSPLTYLDGLADKHVADLKAEGQGAGAETNGSGAGPPGASPTGEGVAAAGGDGAAAEASHPARPGAPGGPELPGAAPAGWADGLGDPADDPSLN